MIERLEKKKYKMNFWGFITLDDGAKVIPETGFFNARKRKPKLYKANIYVYLYTYSTTVMYLVGFVYLVAHRKELYNKGFGSFEGVILFSLLFTIIIDKGILCKHILRFLSEPIKSDINVDYS